MIFNKQSKRWLLVVVLLLAVIAFVYSTHLSTMVPKGYDLLFHLGNVFALKVGLIKHQTLAGMNISPLIFNNLGYGIHLFYPPLAHLLPALASLLLSAIGVNSLILVMRLFWFVTMFLAGLSMFITGFIITKNRLFAFVAGLLFLSSPYYLMDLYWRGGLATNLCFVFLPIFILSLYFLLNHKFRRFFVAFVISFTLIGYTHIITTLICVTILLLTALGGALWHKKRKTALQTIGLALLTSGFLLSPFYVLLLQQQIVQTHVIFSSAYPFNIDDIAQAGSSLTNIFSIVDFSLNESNIAALFNFLNFTLLVILIITFGKVKQVFPSRRFFCFLIALAILLIVMSFYPIFWSVLPSFFAFIQFPHRLDLITTPIIALLSATPFLLIKNNKAAVAGIFTIIAVVFTHCFNRFELFELGQIDYTTHSIIQAMGVEKEYLPILTLPFESHLASRSGQIEILTPSDVTASAVVLVDDPPYLKATITNNDHYGITLELPRLYYVGYQLRFTSDDGQTQKLEYWQSDRGLIKTMVSGDGVIDAFYTGGMLFQASVFLAVGTLVFCVIVLFAMAKKRYQR